MALTIGEKLPEHLGVTQDGVAVSGSSYAGKKLVIYFYPKDDTPGCRAQACNIRDHYESLKKAGYEILGVSIDDDISHKKFKNKYDLPFDLIADTNKELVELFGVWGEKKFMGKVSMGTRRTTFIFNEEGILVRIITPETIKTADHSKQILTP